MRIPRIKLQGRSTVYHCIARVVGAEWLLDDLGKEKLTELLWRVAFFSGIEVITYCMMSNHIHILIRVPESPQLTDAQLIERVEALYGKKDKIPELLRQCIKERGKIDEAIRQGLLARMGNVSEFMKEIKQRFSRWYNRGKERFGTLWAERFRSVVVEDQPTCVEAVAAYIDLNPVRAGMVTDPKDYRFCGYAAAVAGNKLARQGLLSFQGAGTSWEAGAAAYRLRLFVGGGAVHQSGKVVIDKERIKEVVARGGKLSLAEVLRVRVRHMSDGVALGTKAFVNELFVLHREKFGPKRKDGARRVRALSVIGLMALRDLKVKTLG